MAKTLTPSGIVRMAQALYRAARSMLRAHFALFLTVEGWALVSAMMLIGLAALNTAAPLLYLMFAMMCAFFVLSAILATSTIRSIDLERAAPSVWVAGQALRVRLHLRNDKRLLASYSLRVRDYVEGPEVAGAAFFDQVPPRGRVATQEYECVFPRRGLYHFVRLEVATRFPFGLIERRLFFEKDFEILILPQTISLGQTMAAARVELGDFSANVKGQGTGLYGLRTYSPEIPARDIHWKVSAKRGSLIAREYESEEKRRACVILDNRLASTATPEQEDAFEMAIILAASAVEWLCARGHEVELRTASGMVGFGTGTAHVTRCRRALARLQLIQPGAGDMHYLHNPEPDLVRVPVLMGAHEVISDGRVPLSVEDHRGALQLALAPSQPSQGAYKPPRMF